MEIECNKTEPLSFLLECVWLLLLHTTQIERVYDCYWRESEPAQGTKYIKLSLKAELFDDKIHLEIHMIR